jgi:hypothetical protein
VKISAAAFRDKKLISFAVTYNFESDFHIAEFTVQSTDDSLEKFRMTGLSEINLSEDFRHIGYTEFCSLIVEEGRVYLSFDPFNEGVESNKDNFSFVGRNITKVS